MSLPQVRLHNRVLGEWCIGKITPLGLVGDFRRIAKSTCSGGDFPSAAVALMNNAFHNPHLRVRQDAEPRGLLDLKGFDSSTKFLAISLTLLCADPLILLPKSKHMSNVATARP